jgi:benzodiazapine receptor
MATADGTAGSTEQRDWLGLGGWLIASFAAAVAGAVFRPGAWYQQLAKPPLTPPEAVFAPVWLILYALMGIAAWLVWRARGFRGAAAPLTFFIAQLVVNATWSWLFFGLHLPLAAFLDLVILWLLILGAMVLFWRIQRLAGTLLLPYLLWVSYAGYLNLSIWWLNR